MSSEDCAKAMIETVPNLSTTEKLPMFETKAKKKVIFKEKRRAKLKTVEVEDDKERLKELLAIESLSQRIIEARGELRLHGIKDENVEKDEEGDKSDSHQDAPENDDDMDSEENTTSDKKHSEPKCSYCRISHSGEECPITTTRTSISDSLNYQKWVFETCDKKLKSNFETDEQNSLAEPDDEPDEPLPYAEMSLPPELEIKAKNSKRLGVFAKEPIQKYTKLGPLVGPLVEEIDIPDDSMFDSVIEVHDGTKSTFINLEDEGKSNWLKYVRPAPSANDRNAVLVRDEEDIYFVTCKDILPAGELLYWSDKCNTRWKKNLGGKISK